MTTATVLFPLLVLTAVNFLVIITIRHVSQTCTRHIQALLKGAGLPFVFDKALGTRFGVLPRTATDASAMQWLPCEGMMILHVANACQVHKHTIRLLAVVYDEVRTCT